MRISDWSSDVCSSDLQQPADRHDPTAPGPEQVVVKADQHIHHTILALARAVEDRAVAGDARPPALAGGVGIIEVVAVDSAGRFSDRAHPATAAPGRQRVEAPLDRREVGWSNDDRQPGIGAFPVKTDPDAGERNNTRT